MSQTLRRELRNRFEEILQRFSDKLTRAEIESIADSEADAALEVRGIALADCEKCQKKRKRKDPLPKQETPTEVELYRTVTRRYPHSANYDGVIESIQKVGQRLGRVATADDLKPFFSAWTSKGYNPQNLAWLEWAEAGQIPANGTWKAQKYIDEPAVFQAIREAAAMNGATVNG